MKELTDLEKEI
jgi:hypothetical protein